MPDPATRFSALKSPHPAPIPHLGQPDPLPCRPFLPSRPTNAASADGPRGRRGFAGVFGGHAVPARRAARRAAPPTGAGTCPAARCRWNLGGLSGRGLATRSGGGWGGTPVPQGLGCRRQAGAHPLAPPGADKGSPSPDMAMLQAPGGRKARAAWKGAGSPASPVGTEREGASLERASRSPPQGGEATI